jgi:hypothetical protein
MGHRQVDQECKSMCTVVRKWGPQLLAVYVGMLSTYNIHICILNINCKKLSQFPYSFEHSIVFLVSLMMAYHPETCR